jgi:hypothetical protein
MKALQLQRFARQKLGVLVLCAAILAVCGCESRNIDGQQESRIDPNTAAQIESAAGAAIGITDILGVFWPALAPIAAGGAMGLATWLKIRPRLTQYRSEADLYHTIAYSSVEAIELLKQEYPEYAAQLLEYLDAVKNKFIKPDDRARIEAVIRGLRGLPAKKSELK